MIMLEKQLLTGKVKRNDSVWLRMDKMENTVLWRHVYIMLCAIAVCTRARFATWKCVNLCRSVAYWHSIELLNWSCVLDSFVLQEIYGVLLLVSADKIWTRAWSGRCGAERLSENPPYISVRPAQNIHFNEHPPLSLPYFLSFHPLQS